MSCSRSLMLEHLILERWSLHLFKFEQKENRIKQLKKNLERFIRMDIYSAFDLFGEL